MVYEGERRGFPEFEFDATVDTFVIDDKRMKII